MTAPIGPAAGSPAPVPTPPPAGPAATAPASGTGPAAPAPWTPDSLSPEAKAYLDARIADADKKARLDTKTNATNETLAKVAELFGVKPAQDAPVTLETLAQSFGDLTSRLDERDAQEEEAAALADVADMAKELGANPAKVLDSRSLVAQLEAIEADSEAAWNTAAQKVITDALAADPSFKADQATTVRRLGADHTGGGNVRTRSPNLDAAVKRKLGG